MRLRLWGSDHRLAPPSILERLCARAGQVQAELLRLRERGVVAGALVLSTCNRFEVLVELKDGAPEPAAADLLGDDVPLREHRGEAAVDTILGVAAGLHSMVFGEEQILGQLRDAFRQAEELGLLNRRLQMLRTRLLPAARELRRRTGLDQRPPSVASLAVEQLAAAGDRLAIVGAGATGRLLLEILHRRHAREVLVVNRSLDKAQALARHFGGRAMSLRGFRERPPALDGVVYAVRSDAPLLDRATFERAHGAAGGAPRVLVDISQPSVLAADLRAVPSLRVLTLDDLSAVAAAREQQYAAIRATGLVEARALGALLAEELAAGRPNLGRVVDMHLEGAMAELEQAFASRLSHLEADDRDRLRDVLRRTARRAAHLHIQDLQKLAPAR